MRLATLDLGTNTVRLLVADVSADGTWTAVDEAQRVTRLGEGMAATGELGAAAMARTVRTIAEYVDRAKHQAVKRVRIVATSAVREARNGRAFVASVEAATGERVDVITGHDEARLTVRGVLGGLGRLHGTVCVFDIGGGSTEYTLVRDAVIVETASLTLGVVPLAERFPFRGPADERRYRAMVSAIEARLDRDLPPVIRAAEVAELVGTAGTVTTLAALDLGLATYDARRVQGHRLSRAALAAQRARLAGLTVAERAALPCLEPGRADLILPGVAIVEATLERLRAESLIVSDVGLREGVMAEAAETVTS